MVKQNITRRGYGRGNLHKPTLPRPNVDISPKAPIDTIQPITTLPVPMTPNLMPPIYMQERTEIFSEVTQIRIDPHLFDGIKNAVSSAIMGGDYSIESATHFIREALREHAAGTPLKVVHENGTKKSLSVRMDEKLKRFWDTLPKRHRNNILERAVRTKLLAYQN